MSGYRFPIMIIQQTLYLACCMAKAIQLALFSLYCSNCLFVFSALSLLSVLSCFSLHHLKLSWLVLHVSLRAFYYKEYMSVHYYIQPAFFQQGFWGFCTLSLSTYMGKNLKMWKIRKMKKMGYLCQTSSKYEFNTPDIVKLDSGLVLFSSFFDFWQ